jgi:hypothetical protein
MKRIVSINLAVMILLISRIAFTQVIITYNTHAPVIGDAYSYWVLAIAPVIDPGSAGPDQYWDYSQYVGTIQNSDIYMDPGNTPFIAYATGCNLAAFHDAPTQPTYTFIDCNAQSYSVTGGGWEEGGDLMYYGFSDPMKKITFPFAYGDQLTDSYMLTMDYNALGYDMVTEIYGTLTTVADAWGTLKNAVGEYPNTLRIKHIYSEEVKTYMDGNLINTMNMVETEYVWYAPDIKTPVFEFNYIDDDPETYTLFYAAVSSRHEEVDRQSIALPLSHNTSLHWDIRIVLFLDLFQYFSDVLFGTGKFFLADTEEVGSTVDFFRKFIHRDAPFFNFFHDLL